MLRPAHGVLVTSATLADNVPTDSPFALAEMRTGAARLPETPKTLRLASPFDYAANARAIVVTDVSRDDPRQVAAAMRELFLAAGGGAVGLFTAIKRLRAVYEKMAAPLAEKRSRPLRPALWIRWRFGALVDIFRAEEDALRCSAPTQCGDGVDVPGRSLRLLAFDRIPWPRPDLLHKARRGALRRSELRRRHRQSPHRASVRPALSRRADDKGGVRDATRRRADAAVSPACRKGWSCRGWGWWMRWSRWRRFLARG